MLPSGRGMPATPIKLSFLMSASEALTSAATRASSATLTSSIEPSRVFSENVPPSAFSIWPRIRPVCCAKTTVVKSSAIAAAPSARHVIFRLYIIKFLPLPVPGTKGRPQSGGNPGTLALFRAAAHSRFLEEVGLDQGAQFRCHLRLNSEPELKTAHRLVQQHAKSIGGPQPTRACRRQQSRYQRRIDNVGYHHRCRATQIEFQRRLTDHPQCRRIDQEPGAAQQPGRFFPACDLHSRAELLAQGLRLFLRSVDHVDAADFTRDQSVDNRSRSATCP